MTPRQPSPPGKQRKDSVARVPDSPGVGAQAASTDAGVAAVLEGRARWCVVEGDCLDVLATIPDAAVGVSIQDPPYSEHTHSKQRRGGQTENGLPDGFARDRHLGFAHITDEQRASVAAQLARVVTRWTLTFTDSESVGGWMAAMGSAGLQHVRVGAWIKEGCTPQFTGDRPATGMEAIVISHQPGRKRWNGGGGRAVWTHPIVTGINPERTEHTTQKPLPLALELVSLFTDPDEVVCDPFAGSGTFGVAALRLGRRCILIEKSADYARLARERMVAEEQGMSLRDFRRGQIPLFGSAK